MNTNKISAGTRVKRTRSTTRLSGRTGTATGRTRTDFHPSCNGDNSWTFHEIVFDANSYEGIVTKWIMPEGLELI